MKKFIALFLVLCMSMALIACNQKPAETDPAIIPTETSEAGESQAEDFTIVQKPMVSVSLPVTTETTLSEGGTPIFQYIYPTMSLVHPDSAVAEAVIIDHLTRIDSHQSAVTEALQIAEEIAKHETFVSPYLYKISNTPTRIDQGVLSIAGAIVVYTGGAHPNHASFAANYDLTTGNVLTLGSIMSHIDSKEALTNLVIQQLDTMKEDAYLYDDYADCVRQRFQKDESFDEDWYFTDTGLCFFFSPYEIAPYASGTVVAEIPYSSLVGIIADEFFPPEHVQTEGTLLEVPFDGADLSKFSQFSELVIIPEGTKTIYYTDTVVYNIRIETVDPESKIRTVVFAMEALTPGDAITVEADAATMDNLIISYTSGTNVVTVE